MKKNKITSLVCALAMVASMFSAFTVASAADQKITTAATLGEDDVAEITVSYSGFTTVNGLQFTMPIDTDVFDLTNFDADEETSVDATLGDAALNDNELTLVFAPTAVKNYGAGDSEIAKIYIPVKDTSKLPATISLTKIMINDVNADGTETAYVTSDVKGDVAITTDFGVLVDPDAPEPAPARPTAAPVAEEGPSIGGTGVVEDGVATITISYEGFDTVNGLQFTMPIDTDVFDLTDFDADEETSVDATLGDAALNDNELTLVFAPTAVKNYGAGDSEVAKIYLPVKDTTKLPASIQLTKVMVNNVNADGTETAYVTTDVKGDVVITVAPIVVDYAEEPGKVVNEIDLDDTFTDADAAAATAQAAADENKDVYVTVQFVDEDGNAVNAKYGTDYVASYNGKELTADEYNNLINGYTDEKWEDIIKGLTFKIYNDGIAGVKTGIAVDNGDGTGTYIVEPTTTYFDEPNVTPVPVGLPTISTTTKKSSVAVDDTGTFTVTLKTNAYGVDGSVIFTADEDDNSFDYITSKGYKIAYKDAYGISQTKYLSFSEDGSARVIDDLAAGTTTFTVTFVASKKYSTGVKLNATYVGSNQDGEIQVVPAKEASIKITAASTSGGSSSSSSSSGTSTTGTSGVIANGGYTSEGGVYYPGVNFTDLGDASWAADAIAALASAGVINGRDEYTFDPNANITRAEYCQILVGAIGKTGESANSYFPDVTSEAWYYHAVSVASYYGIVEGYDDGYFRPNNLITREEMALMTYKAAKSMGVSLGSIQSLSFSDADQIADWSSEAVYTLANAGIINGMGDDTFAPRANATRAQAAVIIYQAFKGLL